MMTTRPRQAVSFDIERPLLAQSGLLENFNKYRSTGRKQKDASQSSRTIATLQ
jgi:hypothetical protein